MIEIYAPQGSPEWLKARAGVITASLFNTCRLREGAKPTDTQKDDAFRLAFERITGEPLNEGHVGWEADRGHQLEPLARIAHQADIGRSVKQVGLVLTDDRFFGASADGFIGDKGGAEYKCFLKPTKLRRILVDADFSMIEEQAQGCMWVTGREWWDMCLYCPQLEFLNLHLTRRRVKRDDNFINDMVEDLIRFKRLVDQYEIFLRQSGEAVSARPDEEPIPF